MDDKEDDIEEVRRELEQMRMALARTAGVPTRAPARNTLPGTSLKMILLSLAILLPVVIVFFILVLGSWWVAGPWNGVPIGLNLESGGLLGPEFAEQLGPMLRSFGGLAKAIEELFQYLGELLEPFAKFTELLLKPLEWITDWFG
jgi:hypothetical protein